MADTVCFIFDSPMPSKIITINCQLVQELQIWFWGVTSYIYNLWVSLQWTRIWHGMMTANWCHCVKTITLV